MPTMCSESGCKARAWHGDRCNYHAWRLNKAAAQAQPVGLAERRGAVKRRAEQLGIELAKAADNNLRQSELATAVPAVSLSRKVRSPVG